MILNINQKFYLTKNTKGEMISLVPRCMYFQKHGTFKCFLQEIFSRYTNKSQRVN